MTKGMTMQAMARPGGLLLLGMMAGLVAASCVRESSFVNVNHCANQSGNAWCVERYGADDEPRPYCILGDGVCGTTPGQDGCVSDEPSDDECYSPCGDSRSAAEDRVCLGGTETTAGTASTTATTEEPSGTESSSTTGPMPCMGNEDCTDAATPFCDVASGECVGCDGTEDPDGACAGLDPSLPLCVGGACVACTPENPVVCDEQLLLCDGGTNACVPCSEHAQCGSGACELAVGTCFPPDAVVHVDDDGGQDFTSVSVAVMGVEPGAYGVIVVHEIDDGTGYPSLTIDGDRRIALLAAPGEAPILQGTMGNPGLTVQGAGTVLYMDGLRVSQGTGLGLQVDDAFAWVDRSRIVQNSGGGVLAENGAELVLRNCFVGGSVNNVAAIAVNGANATFTYVTAGAGFGTATALACDLAATAEARNSLFVSEDAGGDEIQCSAAIIERSAAELDLGGTNVALGDMATTWFTAYGTGDFGLTPMHPAAIDTAALWSTGDPLTDIDGDPRPAIDGTSDYAGADVP